MTKDKELQIAVDDRELALAEGETPKAVYAWCNLHGLWKAEF